MEKKRILALFIILFLMASLILEGCTPSGESTSEGGQLKFSITTDISTLDPQHMTDSFSFSIANALYEGLLRVHDGRVLPGIASSWDVSDDKLTYTFHLRDAVWSDGSKITAYDFEYAIKRLLDPKTASNYAFIGYYILNGEEFNTGKISNPEMVGVKALDDKTLQITLKAPTKYFDGLLGMASFMPVKKDFVERMGEKFGADADKALYNGPFVLKEWKHEQELVLKKNPNYWNKDEIKLDEVRVYIVGDKNTAYQMFEKGQIDFADVPEALIESVISRENTQKYNTGRVYFIRYNMKSKDKPWLANENFRKAIGYAVDREDFIKMAFKGAAYPATRFIPPDVNGVEKKFTQEFPMEYYPPKADVTKAKEYLSKAMQELGVSEANKLGFELMVDDTSGTKTGVEIIQDMLRRNLGIDVEVKTVTFKERLQRMRKGEYEVMITRWGPDYNDPMTYLEYWLPDENMKNSGWEDQTYDGMIKNAGKETDFKKRAEIMFEAEKYLLNKAPMVPLYFTQNVWVKKGELQNLVRAPIGGVDIDFVYAFLKK